jgi:RecA-family ATPase
METQRIYTEEETEDRLRLEFILNECYIDPTEKIDHPPIALSYGQHSYETSDGPLTYDTPIGTYGNFSFIQGPPKTKKTFLTSLFSAAYLGGNSERFSGKIKGHRDNKVLMHFDTEQGKFHAQRTFKRVLDMCGVSHEYYKTYGLRSVNYKDRLKAIEIAIDDTKNLGLVIIDGIADLMGDVNNIEEANALVQKIMSLSQQYNIHIMTIIHSNFGSDKPTGHLGSAMEKKAETQIQLERDSADSNIVKVMCKRSRNRAFDTFSFYVNKFGFPQMAYEDLNWIDNLTNDKD